jgi:hypothetical protein
MSLLRHVVELVRKAGGDVDASSLTAFYFGLAIGTQDPTNGRRLLCQMEREMAEATGQPAEVVETRMREASGSVAAYLDHAVEEEPA